ncbi:hypothetical protein SADUNF_Sadunf05G0019900 [Salix dunnii]|uniref:Uncharacterized protein n=1 Tax=Salix dunnii TaxID=1413687 RepID=A0A835K950_9ROSI|nr:hypothetical protein SADUNF_Sadunf05G0019900 [Salix dunnii]
MENMEAASRNFFAFHTTQISINWQNVRRQQETCGAKEGKRKVRILIENKLKASVSNLQKNLSAATLHIPISCFIFETSPFLKKKTALDDKNVIRVALARKAKKYAAVVLKPATLGHIE